MNNNKIDIKEMTVNSIVADCNIVDFELLKVSVEAFSAELQNAKFAPALADYVGLNHIKFTSHETNLEPYEQYTCIRDSSDDAHPAAGSVKISLPPHVEKKELQCHIHGCRIDPDYFSEDQALYFKNSALRLAAYLVEKYGLVDEESSDETQPHDFLMDKTTRSLHTYYAARRKARLLKRQGKLQNEEKPTFIGNVVSVSIPAEEVNMGNIVSVNVTEPVVSLYMERNVTIDPNLLSNIQDSTWS